MPYPSMGFRNILLNVLSCVFQFVVHLGRSIQSRLFLIIKSVCFDISLCQWNTLKTSTITSWPRGVFLMLTWYTRSPIVTSKNRNRSNVVKSIYYLLSNFSINLTLCSRSIHILIVVYFNGKHPCLALSKISSTS